jgi:DNA repair protein RadA/Sms
MAKKIHICTNCKHEQIQWTGTCPTCKEVGTLEEGQSSAKATTAVTLKPAASNRMNKATTNNVPVRIRDVKKHQNGDRLKTNIGELDRVLGGGIVSGAVVLLAGAPGAGKSSLLSALTQTVAEQGKTVLYISGEENETQIADRHERIKATHDNILILSESNTDNAEDAILSIKPDLIIVDSIQTLLSPNSESRIGSPSQVTEVANLFTNIAKKMNIPTIMIGHLTKNESIAGPRVVEHLVDVVLYLEVSIDSPLRMLRGIKNRFGSTDEVGLFQHADEGLLEITDPSGMFSTDHADDVSGYATTVMVEGLRAIICELTALVTPSPLPNPRKISHGLDHARCIMVQAILEKHAGLKIGDKDVYVSTTNGLVVKDSSIDLAIAAALISSFYDVPPQKNTVYLGELSLTGEVRAARFNDRRKREAERLGSKVYDYTTITTIRELVNMVHKDLGKKK